MTDSDQHTSSGTIPIDPDEGFGPQIADQFIEQYGEGSVFVTATVDCLTHRFIHLLIKSERLPQDHRSMQYGDPAMRETLENLLGALVKQGMSEPFLLLMRSAVGHEEPRAFLATASVVLGDDLIVDWLHRLEQEDYVGADSLLVVH